jgi:hypothetical protein
LFPSSSTYLFQDSEEIIQSAEINDTSYESQADLHWENEKKFFFEKHKKQKNV